MENHFWAFWEWIPSSFENIYIKAALLFFFMYIFI